MATVGFSGIFSISNWNFNITQGNILTNNAPTSVTLVSGNSGRSGDAIMSIPITSPGYITFSFTASTLDDSLYWDPFGYIKNSSRVVLADSSRQKNITGTITVNVAANDVFGFYINTRDGVWGSSTTIVNNFIFSPSPTIGTLTIPTKTYGDIPFTITQPTSNSSGTFSYSSSDTSVATISGNIITIVGAGTSTITATQAATIDYTSGTTTTTFLVNKAIPTITNFSIPDKTYGDAPFQITRPTSNSSGTFSYSSSDTSVATISGNIITIVGAGTSTITATQAATPNYTSGTTTTTFQAVQSTSTDPVIINNGANLVYFMNTSSTYANLTNNLEINYDLIAPSYKLLTGNNITITKSNN